MPQCTDLCARCHVEPKYANTSYCTGCKSVLNREARTRRTQRELIASSPKTNTDVADAAGRPCARCKAAPRLSHMSYCRECHRALARESRERTGGKKPQEFCSKCGEKRYGRHASYCPPCNEIYRAERIKLPCARCGVKRSPGSGNQASYCYPCERDRWLLKKYGITSADYDKMLAEQDGRCALCLTESNGRMWHVDHDHKTNRTRRLLCDLCNRGLGHFQDDPAVLRRAAEYIEEFEFLAMLFSD
jgi:hypothetical protein